MVSMPKAEKGAPDLVCLLYHSCSGGSKRFHLAVSMTESAIGLKSNVRLVQSLLSGVELAGGC